MGTSLPSVPTQCTECALTGNLWLCLVCGLAQCGRQQFGGVDGNGHALKHKEETGHAVAVKLGTITPEGTAGELLIGFGTNAGFVADQQICIVTLVMMRNLTLSLLPTWETWVWM